MDQFLGENKNYRFEKKLGADGTGDIWLAAEIRGGREVRKVTVRPFRPDGSGNEGVQRKILKRIQTLQRLNHPNICPVYAIERDPAYGLLIISGYGNGGSYVDWFRNQPKQNGGVPLKTVCSVLRPIAGALDSAHRLGVIHGNVRAENMMFTTVNGVPTPWLANFAIVPNFRPASQSDSSANTASYRPPELEKGQLAPQTDQYMLACTAMEFLAGTTIHGLQKLPQKIQRVLIKALALNPADRYATCSDFIDALLVTTLPESPNGVKRAVMPPTIPPIQKKDLSSKTSPAAGALTRSNLQKYKWFGIAGLVLLLIVGVALWPYSKKIVEEPEPVAVEGEPVEEPAPVIEEEPEEPEIVESAPEEMPEPPEEDMESMKDFFISRAKDNAEDLFQLGEKWATADHGKGTQDWNKAVDYYRQAAELGHARAMVSLGTCYFYGRGVERDLQKMIMWCRKAADLGEPGAYFNLGNCYAKGQDVPKDEVEAKSWYEKCVQTCNEPQRKDDPWCQCLLGICYSNGNAVPVDKEEAVRLFRQSAEQGLPEGQCYLGVCFLYGNGVEKDEKEAAFWFRKAAEQGIPEAMGNLGTCYLEGYGVEKDIKEAVNWYSRGADQGIPELQYNMGHFYLNGIGVPKDGKKAVYWYRKAAEQGFARAQYDLGVCYNTGIGVAKDPTEATKLFRKAAEQGYAEGQFNLAVSYLDGIGISKNVDESVKWMRKAAEQGLAQAQYGMSIFYQNGIGVPANGKEALYWLRKSAEQGFVNAQYDLGCYCHFKSENLNPKEAVYWYRKAAEQGLAIAQNNLGICYEQGIGVLKDEKEAVKWYTKSAEQGCPEGQNSLGVCYMYGVGVSRDLNKGKYWINKAADQGLDIAIQNLQLINSML